MVTQHWFRIHLSTAIFVALVAGGVLWANCDGKTDSGGDDTVITTFGWPYEGYSKYEAILPSIIYPTLDDGFISSNWTPTGVIWDFVVGIAICLGSAILAEYIVRTPRKPVENRSGRRAVKSYLVRALVLTICLGILVWQVWCVKPHRYISRIQCYTRGWPVIMNDYKDGFQNTDTWARIHNDNEWDFNKEYKGRCQTGLEGDWNFKGILINISTSVGVLIVVNLLAAATIRRRANDFSSTLDDKSIAA